MRLGNKKKVLAGLAAFCFLLGGSAVSAAGKMAVVESYTGENGIILYIKGITRNISDIQVQAGTAVCDSITYSRLSESGQSVKTLIMLDNSLSIKKADRARIAQIIQNILSGRMENEEMAIAVFHEGIEYLADYTSDDAVLADAAESISYQSANTFLTDVLYEVLSAENDGDAMNVFRRMIVISDGMDHKSIGYTKDELYNLLKEHSVPIYTVGAQTKKKDNNDQLENMFAISRMTGAEGFLLSDMESLSEVNKALSEDREIIRLTVNPPDELLDGSRRTIKITLDSGESISSEAVMPQQVKAAAEAAGQDKTAGAAGSDETVAEPEEIEDEDMADGKTAAGPGRLVLFLAPVCLLAAAAIVILVWKRKKAYFQSVSQNAGGRPVNQPGRQLAGQEDNGLPEDDFGDDEVTDFMEMTEAVDDNNTVVMWDEHRSRVYELVLTDIRTPARSFRVPLQTSVIIGRKQGVCGIAIDDDMSVSGRHCEIAQRDGRFYITDLQSSNGTYVDGCRIESESEIVAGSVIKMGKSEFRMEVTL